MRPTPNKTKKVIFCFAFCSHWPGPGRPWRRDTSAQGFHVQWPSTWTTCFDSIDQVRVQMCGRHRHSPSTRHKASFIHCHLWWSLHVTKETQTDTFRCKNSTLLCALWSAVATNHWQTCCAASSNRLLLCRSLDGAIQHCLLHLFV